MFPVIEEQAKINAFSLVSLPSASKLYHMYGYRISELTADDTTAIDVTAGSNKLNDLRNAATLDEWKQYDEAAEARAVASEESSSPAVAGESPQASE